MTIKPGFTDTPMTESFKKGLMWTKPAVVAAKIVWATDNKKDEVYIPAFWWLVMVVIKMIPATLFKKISF